MPNYDFKCKKCNHEYSDFAKFDPKDQYKDVKCPECNSSKKDKLMSVSSYKFNQPVGTDCWTSDETGHDYRYKYILPGIKKQREIAEQTSHVGKNPYKEIDDISSGENFGEVK